MSNNEVDAVVRLPFVNLDKNEQILTLDQTYQMLNNLIADTNNN